MLRRQTKLFDSERTFLGKVCSMGLDGQPQHPKMRQINSLTRARFSYPMFELCMLLPCFLMYQPNYGPIQTCPGGFIWPRGDMFGLLHGIECGMFSDNGRVSRQYMCRIVEAVSILNRGVTFIGSWSFVSYRNLWISAKSADFNEIRGFPKQSVSLMWSSWRLREK